MKYLKTLIIVLFLFANFVNASVFIGPEDELKIKKIELLGFNLDMNPDTLTYPLTINKLNSTPNISHLYISEIINYKNSLKDLLLDRLKTNTQLSFKSFSDYSPIRNINDAWKSKSSINFKTSYTKQDYSFTFSISSENSLSNDKTYFFDNSHISYSNGKIILGAGFINRWWGPSHNNNLILSNYSRPSFGVFLDSAKSFNFKSKLLSKLKNINYSFFINRLEKNRFISNPYLIGSRVTINPINNLFLGFSRTLTIGGEGRREDLTTLSKAFFGALEGADNPGVQSGTEGGYDYSNQLAGFDIKYSFSFLDKMFSLYLQEIAEDGDTSPTSPFSKYIITYGGEIKYNVSGLLRAYSIEFSRTVADRSNDAQYNTIYEHGSYRSGYRYRNLPIGAFIDSDSEYLQLSHHRELINSNLLSTSIFYAEPNKDANGRSIWGDAGEPFYGLKIKYKLNFSKNFSTELILTSTDKSLTFLEKEMNKNIIGIIGRYNF